MRLFNLFLILSIPVFFSSCMSYQYVTLKSDLPIESGTSRYYTEKENIKISYDFNGISMPVTSRIYNDSDSDLYVDLNNSVFTLNNRVVASARKGQTIKLDMSTSTTYPDVGSYSSGGGTISASAGTLYIPPGAYAEVVVKPYHISFDPSKKSTYTEIEKRMSAGTVRYVRRYDFAEDARHFGVTFRVSKKSDFSDAWNMASEFKEQSLYNFPARPLIVPNGPARNYITYKNNGRDIGAGIGYGLLIFCVLLPFM